MWSPMLPLFLYDFAQVLVGWDFFEYFAVQFQGAFLAFANFYHFEFGCNQTGNGTCLLRGWWHHFMIDLSSFFYGCLLFGFCLFWFFLFLCFLLGFLLFPFPIICCWPSAVCSFCELLGVFYWFCFHPSLLLSMIISHRYHMEMLMGVIYTLEISLTGRGTLQGSACFQWINKNHSPVFGCFPGKGTAAWSFQMRYL